MSTTNRKTKRKEADLRRNEKGKEKEKDTNEPEVDVEEASRPRKVARKDGGIQLKRIGVAHPLHSPLVSKQFVFLPPSASSTQAHASIPFYEQVSEDEGSDRYQAHWFECEKPHVVPFGGTQFTDSKTREVNEKSLFTACIPLNPSELDPTFEDNLIVDRLTEADQMVKAYLLSDQAEDAWKLVGIEQPQDEKDLSFVPSVSRWSPKDKANIVKQDFTLKFPQTYQKRPLYTLFDCRQNPDDPVAVSSAALIEKGDCIRPVVFADTVYIHIKDRKRKSFITGIVWNIRTAEITSNPDSLVTYVDD